MKRIMYPELEQQIKQFNTQNISVKRKELLLPLVEYIRQQLEMERPVRLVFICTHNSRRSHLAQIWAQTMAYRFGLKEVQCYSGGTEATAVFPKVAATLLNQGFQIQNLSEGSNPVYAVKFADNEAPLICFSKVFENGFNPQSEFCAIMTCSSADEGCPFVPGAEKRIPVKYEDPKAFDGTAQMDAKYTERSLEIGQEMFYVFSAVSG